MKKLTLLILSAVIFSSTIMADGIAGQSHTATLDDKLKIHYTIYGAAEPTVVFIHGWACDESVWNGQALELGKDLRCVTIDLPRHGQSDKSDLPYTMHLYARATDAVLRDAKVSSAVLVGHSNGTPVIRQFYREFAAKVRALVIVDGTLRALADASTIRKFLEPFRGPDYSAVASNFVDGLTRSIKDEALRAQIKTTILRTPQNVAVSELESTLDPELWKPDKIEVPVLMIMAKQPAWTPEYEKFVRDLVPHLDYQMWKNVSHFIMMEEPEKFNNAIRTWLTTSGFLKATS